MFFYTDGVSGLRLYPDNVIEYTATVKESRPYQLPPKDTVKRSIDFVTNHGGWPARSYLKSLTKLDPYVSKYNLEFGYFAYGFPLVAEQADIEITIKNGEVIRYYRDVVSPIRLKIRFSKKK